MSHGWVRRSVRLGWGWMNVYVAGEGPPILLLHGLGGSGRYWAGLSGHLGGRTLIAPDLAGFGRSGKPAAAYTRDFHLDALDHLLEDLGESTPLAVAGHSMGGVLAALFTVRHPERVGRLAVVASPFPRAQEHPHGVPRGPGSRALYAVARRTLPLLSPLVRSDTFPRAVIADYLRHTPESYRLTSRALIWDPSIAGDLAALAVPSTRDDLLLYSDEDTTIDRTSLTRWRTVLPDAEVRTRAGGHQLLLRGGFADLAAWLSATPATRVA